MKIEEQLKRAGEKGRELQREVRERTVGYVVAALGLVAGLAWNDAIKSLIEYLFPQSQGTLFAKFLYAFGVTIAVVVVTVYLVRLLRRGDQDNK